MTDLKTDFLIVGAGPAGASMACFLGQHGLSGVMIAVAPSTADTPRAHITNMAALECLRDIGLEEACLQVATASGNMEHTRWCHSMAGEEYARTYSWGRDPARKGDYDAASACEHVDLPQTLLEPILVNRAKEKGWDVRFSTNFVAYKRDSQGRLVSEVKDNVTGASYTITSRYLFGCDGARSQVMRQLGIPLIKKPPGMPAFNVQVEVDLSRFVENRMGNLHWVMQPDREPLPYAWINCVRMVKPWTRWMFIVLARPDYDPAVHGQPTEEQWKEQVRLLIGDSSVPFEIINVSKWTVNEVVAERYSEGNIFCLGDAVHRHPPANGLGSNTCIQDAYNLAWKIAMVHNSQASPSLLDTYSHERQPVGHGVITRANDSLRHNQLICTALGATEADVTSRMAAFNELKSATPAGRKRREDLKAGIEGTAHEFHAVGQEMNQRYDSSAIIINDEKNPRPPLPANPILTHQISTYPGARLPHAWLNTPIPGPKISTHDLAGHGTFTLFTGPGGTQWKQAAARLSQDPNLNITVKAYSIGWRQDYEDVYFDWARRREVEEDGCVLVRPDRFVCWRSNALPEGGEGQCEAELRRVLGAVLGRDFGVAGK